ncbi:ATP-dependent nuclease [Streptomyces mangrovisoli]|uniref:ATP-dependent nuclease n=1 Tax=Streptomyces mangrovisoli TaxID=1428628 RepID=UPI001160D6C2|nr:ATP-binding protein [Streptomyces mangrovisoli]
MQLSGLSVKNYRSIKQTPRLTFGELAVLVGPNNEGKSNILRAAVMGMRILRRFGMTGSVRANSSTARLSSRQYYDWFEDYPKDLQEKTPNGSTIIDFWFELDDEEKALFKSRIGVSLKTELPIRLTVNRYVEFTVRKQGPGKETLNRKAGQVASFVGRHLRIEYVGSVRTAADATEVIREMLRDRITEALDAEQYESLVSQLSVAVTNAMKPLAIELQETLKDFIPDIADVRIQVTEGGILDGLIDETKVLIDDGAETDLRHKGDGVQSLAALAMARKVADSGRRSLILAIEEPEAHLHPSAVHRVRQVVNEIASKQQVIYTTHSPLLVDRFKLSNNVIVRGSKATPAKTLNELRDVLGVRTSDNLAQAALVLIVEGLTDRYSLEALIVSKSPKLSTFITNGALALDHLKGASNLLPKLDGLRQQLCQYHVLLDHDSAGLMAGSKARDAGLLSTKEETYTIVPSMKESEFEDTLNVELYKSEISKVFGVSLDVPEFKREKIKWGDRMEAAFRSQGKVYDTNVGMQVKMLVSKLVTSNPDSALHPRRASSIDALCVQLENRIDEMEF